MSTKLAHVPPHWRLGSLAVSWARHVISTRPSVLQSTWSPGVGRPGKGFEIPLVTPPLSGHLCVHNREQHTMTEQVPLWWTEDPHALKSQDFQLRFWALSSLTPTPVETAFSYSRLSKESQAGLPSGWLLCFLLLYGIFGPPRTFCRCTRLASVSIQGVPGLWFSVNSLKVVQKPYFIMYKVTTFSGCGGSCLSS